MTLGRTYIRNAFLDPILEGEKFNFEKFHFEKADFEKVDFEKVDFENLDFEKVDFENLDFEKVDLEKVDVEKVDFENLDFEHLDFEKVNCENLSLWLAEKPTWQQSPLIINLNGKEVILGDVIISNGVIQYNLGRQLLAVFLRRHAARHQMLKIQTVLRNVAVSC
ncbi:hypothetical protein B0T10DRAFT_611517 [Thelonectria olida]|uniref:Pentapeptide repeat-containing protein n=1 Tax=Thelonectria olida TaxID=1576542 RepID=A0A9P9AEG2_9HYPO|nr:hypothetical protein B0T10DRAFT_611517 [Thelonectria olida]